MLSGTIRKRPLTGLREAIKKKKYEILDIVQNSETPLPPRLVWTHKVWTLSLGADPPPPYRSLDILTLKV